VTAGLSLDGTARLGAFALGIDLAVPPRTVTAVLGPNGAGKSTLLRVIAGLQPLATGRLLLDSTVLDDPAGGVFIPPERRPVGLVFQDYRLFPHLTVRDNVAYPLRRRGYSRHEAHRTAESLLARFGLGDLVRRRPAALSGGQAQRVALARSLVGDTALLLLDEPMAALDARTRIEVRTEIRRRLAEFDGPTVLVTHDPLEAMVLADELIVLEGGTVVQRGRPADVARRPITEYVARLVGLNLFPGTQHAGFVGLDGGGNLVASGVVADDRAVPVVHSMPAVGQRVLVAVRPESVAVHLHRPEGASPRNVWPGVVAGLEMLVDRVRIEVDATPRTLVDLTPAAVAELGLAGGREVWLSVKATDVLAYPDPR
jgi:molybdate transport system ATP-binding protein